MHLFNAFTIIYTMLFDLSNFPNAMRYKKPPRRARMERGWKTRVFLTESSFHGSRLFYGMKRHFRLGPTTDQRIFVPDHLPCGVIFYGWQCAGVPFAKAADTRIACCHRVCKGNPAGSFLFEVGDPPSCLIACFSGKNPDDAKAPPKALQISETVPITL